MKAVHRRWHVRMWLILGPLVLLGTLWALALRRTDPLRPAVTSADSQESKQRRGNQ